MRTAGFSAPDYHVMDNSCNRFTEEVARRLELLDRYPSAVLSQSKIGEMLSPMAKLLDLVPGEEKGSSGGQMVSLSSSSSVSSAKVIPAN